MGVGIGLACAAPILIIATMNIITGLMATLTIAAVTLCVIGFIPILGWKLGVSSCVSITIIISITAVFLSFHSQQNISMYIKDIDNF